MYLKNVVLESVVVYPRKKEELCIPVEKWSRDAHYFSLSLPHLTRCHAVEMHEGTMKSRA